jgi:hypothetical protein
MCSLKATKSASRMIAGFAAEVTRMNPSAPISPGSCSEPAHPRDIDGCDIPLMNAQTLALN